MKKTFPVIMLPSNERTNIFLKVNELEYNTKPPIHGINHLGWKYQVICLTANEDLKKDDWCVFYNQLSKVIETNGTSAKIETISAISKEDAELINRIKRKDVCKEGDFSSMIHSFSVRCLPKIIASTDELITPKSWIPEPSANVFIEAYNKGIVIKEAHLDMETSFVMGGGLLPMGEIGGKGNQRYDNEQISTRYGGSVVCKFLMD